MAGQDIEYTGLTIKISADSQDANKSIASIRKGLVALDETAKNLDQKQIKEVEKILRDIAKIDFSNVSKGLQSVVTAFKQLNSISGKQANKKTGKSLTGEQQPNVMDFSSLDMGFKLPKFKNNFTTATKELQDFQSTVKRVTKATVELNGVFSMSGTAGKVKTLKNEFDKGENALKKWLKRAKEIAKYRIIRKVIQEIYKALVQGIQAVAIFDDRTNEAMSKIKSSATYFINSIGAMLSPLIQIFEPFLTSLNQTFAEAGNTFAEFFAIMNGQDTFAKAKEDLIDYRNTLKSTTTGIDELNVLNKQDGFEVAQVDASKEGMQDIKGIFTDIVAMVKDLVELATPFVKGIIAPLGKVLKAIVGIVTNIVKLIKELVGETFEDVNESLFSFVNMVGDILGFVDEIVNALMPTLTAILNVISPILNIINSFLTGIFDNVGGIFRVMTPLLQVLKMVLEPLTFVLNIVATIFTFIEGIAKMLFNIFSFNWGNIVGDWESVFGRITSMWQNYNSNASYIKIPESAFATGGFPEDGLFFANSTELVGRFDNGKTAVANNEMITEGIYQAVLQAMKESGGNNVVVNLDGYELARIVTERQGNFGADIVKGGKLKFGM